MGIAHQDRKVGRDCRFCGAVSSTFLNFFIALFGRYGTIITLLFSKLK
jgi:hypothetical protein